MRTLISTPAYGGMVTVPFARALLTEALLNPDRIKSAESQSKYDLSINMLGNESLISRARNTCASVAIEGGYDSLLFIDADVSWHWRDLKKILDSPSPIISGLCPLKTYPILLNYHPFKDDLERTEGAKTPMAIKKLGAHYKSVEVSVGYVGTAFMRIDISVFKRLIEMGVPSYKYMVDGKVQTHYDFFQTGPEDDQYFSEDWGFCKLARQAGYEIKVHTGVFVSHTGNHMFRCGNEIDLALG